MRFLQKRKISALGKIFPGALITLDTIDKIEMDWTNKITIKQKVYVVSGHQLDLITPEHTKKLEKKRLRIASVNFETKQIILQRKLKVFDWFLVYAAMRISIGVLAFYGLVVWLG